MTKRIENAINVFLDAINNGTLAKGTCVACAVGNLVAHGMGAKIYKEVVEDWTSFNCDKENSHWSNLFRTAYDCQDVFHRKLDSNVIRNIESTEFKLSELMKIEFAFETNTKITFDRYTCHTESEIKQDQIKGLEAVIKVMMEFDNDQFDIQEQFTSKVKMVTV